jgi:hypothetical protein
VDVPAHTRWPMGALGGPAGVSQLAFGSDGRASSRPYVLRQAQNMVENSLSVLSFDGKSLKVTGEIKVKGGPEGLRTSER